MKSPEYQNVTVHISLGNLCRSYLFVNEKIERLNTDPSSFSPEGQMCLRTQNLPDWCGSVGWALSQKPKVTGSIPGQDTCLGLGPGPWLGACKRQPINVSLPLPPPFLSLSNKNK